MDKIENMRKEQRAEWQLLRQTKGIIGGTMDLHFMGLPNHPDPRNWIASHFRGTIEQITWKRKEGSCGSISTITLRDLQEYLPGKRSWQRSRGPRRVCCEYCGLFGCNRLKNGTFSLSLAINLPAVIIPKGQPLPRRHALYETRSERQAKAKRQEEFLKKLFSGK